MILRSIGGPNALSRWSVLLPLLLLLPLRLADQRIQTEGHAWAYIAATLAGLAFVAVGALAAHATYLRPDGRGPRPMAALLTFFALGCLRTAGVAATEILLGVPLSRPVLPELLIGGVQGAVVLALIAIWVDSQRQYRDSRRRLLVIQDRIRTARAMTRVRVDELLAALVLDVTERVDERWRVLAAVSSDRLAAASALRGVSEDYVRPLSHEIHRQWLVEYLRGHVHPVDRAEANPAQERRGLAEVRAVAADLRAPNPYITTGLMLMLATGTLVRVLGPTTTALLIAATVPVMVAGGFAVGRLMDRLRGHPVGVPAALVIGSLAVAAVSVIVDAAVLSWTTGSADWLFATLATYPFLAIIVSLGRTALALEDQAQQQLAASIAEDGIALEASNAHLAQLREVTTHFLHDAVQAELVASALMLQSAPPSEVDIERELGLAYERIAAEIGSACTASLVPSRDRVRQHLEFWRDAADLEYEVESICWDRLDQRPEAATTLGQVLSVGLTNAIRHGQHGPIRLSLGAEGDDGVLVTITNPGYLDRRFAKQGDLPGEETTLGLETISNVSRDWDLSSTDGSVTLHAVI